MFLGKGVPKICSKFTGEHPCRSAISVKLLCNFIEIAPAPRHGCSPVNLKHLFLRTPLDGSFYVKLCKSFAPRPVFMVLFFVQPASSSWQNFCKFFTSQFFSLPIFMFSFSIYHCASTNFANHF